MKKIIYIIGLTVLFYSCAKEDANNAPTIPELVFPANNQACTDLNLTLEWEPSVDSEDDQVSYVLEVSNTVSFSQLLLEEVVEESSKSITVTGDAVYYWRVLSKDNSGATSEYSSVFSFYSETEGIENHVPFATSLVSPSQNEDIASGAIKLEWQGEDLDENDVLTFDVYVGISETMLQNEAMGITNEYYDINVTSGTYYWRVDVQDSNGAEAIGQVWQFTVQ